MGSIMIGDLLSQLRNQYTLQNAPNNAPAMGDPNGLTGLLQTSGVPMTQNPIGMRTPNYMGLLGMMGNQPPPWGAQQAPQGQQGSYLDTVMGGAGGGSQMPIPGTQTGNAYITIPDQTAAQLMWRSGIMPDPTSQYLRDQIAIYNASQGG
jgi:hypothetical protein